MPVNMLCSSSVGVGMYITEVALDSKGALTIVCTAGLKSVW